MYNQNITKGYIILKHIFTTLLLTLSLGVNASVVELGNADDYVVATGGYGSVNIGSSSHITGNVGSDYYVSIGSSSVIEGSVCSPAEGVGSGASYRPCNNPVSFYDDILNASNILAAMPPTESLFSIQKSMELSPGVYAIDSLSLSNDETLTLSGDPDDVFVINISGYAAVSMQSKILLDGVSSSNVFFNFLNSREYSGFSFSGSEIAGTFISSARSFIMGTGQSINDARFFTNGSVISHLSNLGYSPSIPNEDISPVPVWGFNILFVLIFALAVFPIKTRQIC